MDSQPDQPAFIFGDTIFALSSGHLPAGIAVVRLSGSRVRFVLETIAGGAPTPRQVRHCLLRSRTGDEIDRGLVLFFPGPKSFTGEDCAEFHVHGGRAVVDALLSALSVIDGCRMAEAGEFTRRAFAYGKLDLTEAEGLADLIAAETEAQRRLALAVASGAQRELYEGWRSELVRGRALIEAELDFSDEADVPGSVSDRVWRDVEDLARGIRAHIAGARRGEIIHDGYRVVILGAPNVGKSSLINALAGREVAIISDEAGTTRDPLEVKLDLDGIPVLVTDTAGLREATGKIEQIGMERARARAANADLILLLEDLSEPAEIVDVPDGVAVMRVGTKCDLVRTDRNKGDHDLAISVISGKGLDRLIEAMAAKASEAGSVSAGVVPTRRRHLGLLEATVAELETAVQAEALDVELRTEYLRRASDALGRITGTVDVEDILDVVFSQFCIGK